MTEPAAAASPAAPSTRIFLRPIASPFPLGFAGLATASLLVAGSELGWFAPSDRPIVGLVLVAFTFPIQMLATVFGFLGRDSSAATSFGVQGGMWLVVGLDRLVAPPGSTSHALGVLLCAAAGWVTLCALGAAMGKLVPASILLVAATRFLLTGLYQLTASHGIEHAGGVTGLVLVGLCAYAILAMEIEGLQRRSVLPVLRRGSGREAMTAGLAQQSQRLEHEPGVREQL